MAARVVVACGYKDRTNQELRCRYQGANSSENAVPASWDDERQALCCAVPKEDFCKQTFSFDVVDASGNVVFKAAECRQDPGSDCCRQVDGKDCCKEAADAGGGPGESASAAAAPSSAILSGLSWLDRLLPVWIIAAMVIGVLLGSFVPQVRSSLSVAAHIGGVSLPIALGLWVMMLPVLTKVEYELLGVFLKMSVAKQFGVSFVLNWLLGPALMTALAWACLPDLPGFRNGVIMVGLARCIAMVLLWNELAGGDSELCAVMVAFNSVLQIVLYAPLSLLYLQVVSGTSGVQVGFWPVAKSVLLFLGIPLVAGILLRLTILKFTSKAWFQQRFMRFFGPCALLGLLYTIIVMFAAQDIIGQVTNVARVAVPMLLYFILMFFSSLLVSRWCGMGYAFSATQAFTAASNNFELAIAVAVGTFGVQSQEALAATVGPLIEVPVLLALVYVALWLKRRVWDKAAACVPPAAETALFRTGSQRL